MFLWVELAVQSLLRGIRNGDSWENIQHRLTQLPSGIFELYTHMWKRLAEDEPIYAQEAALFLRLVQSYGGMSLVHFAILADDHLQATFSGPVSTWNTTHLLAEVRCDQYRARIAACCAGYLEIVEVEDWDDWEEEQVTGYRKVLEDSTIDFQPEAIVALAARYRSHVTLLVGFIHRTIADYLRTPTGREIL